MMFREKKYSIFFLFLTGGFFFLFLHTHAVAGPYDYTSLESIPGTGNVGSNLAAYLQAIYKFSIWTVGIAAILMITIGGFMYMTSAGNTSKMDVAKRVVTDAVIGLVIALSAYLLLYVINPDLVKITINLPGLGSGSGTGNQQTNLDIPSPSDSNGCSAIVNKARDMKNSGCQYDQSKRSDGCSTKPGYTDCSKFVGDSYLAAGCRKPGNVSGDFLGIGESIGESSSLKAGDVLAVPGHVVVCENSRCSTVIHASGKQAGIKESNGDYYLKQGSVRVVRASRFCDNCKS